MVHEGLWQKLAGLDRRETAKRSKCQYLDNPQRYLINLLNNEYVVNLSDKEIFPAQGGSQPAGFLEQLCILAYLINAKDLPLADKLVKAETLPGGQFFFRGVHGLPTRKLEEAFGQCPERLCQITGRFDAKECEFGNASIELYILPRIPITIVIWAGDDEFKARGSILFDRTAAEHLPLDALLAAADLTINALVTVLDKSS